MKIRIDFSVTIRPPTERQIEFADAIAEALGINFPRGSWDYTFDAYSDFISAHVDKYYELMAELGDGAEYDAFALQEVGEWFDNALLRSYGCGN